MKKASVFLCLFISSTLGAQGFPVDTSRFLNLGFSIGKPHQIAYPTDNNSGYYLTNGDFFDFKTFNIAISGEWIKRKGLGYGLQLGFRQFYLPYSEEKDQSPFEDYEDGFAAQTIFLTPLLVYSLHHSDESMWNLSFGSEVHFSLGEEEFLTDRGTFFVDPASAFVLLRLGTEIQWRVTSNVFAGFYFNITQGLSEIGSLSLAEPGVFEVNRLGEYYGTGFEIGLRFNLCYRCMISSN